MSENNFIFCVFRLASISERRVKQDQRKVEDTLSSNRQSDLEKDFSSFFDEDRLDACEKMLSIFQKEEDEFNYIHYPRLACIILEAAYEQVKEARNGCVDLFKEFTRVMVENAAQMGTFVVTRRKLFRERKGSGDPFQFTFKACIMEEPTKFPKNAMDGLLLSLKENAERCFLDKLMEGFLDKVLMKWNKWYEEDKSCLFTPSYQLLENLDQYIKACLRLSWRIVTQVPPMNLEYQTLKLDINIHKKLGYHNRFKGREKSRPSAQENQEDIACYLWPGLQDGGGRVIRAGEVLCVIPEEEKSG
ncbi:unnamed protein product [Porites evermanni]|uniref:Mitochondria-eating protein n=1 Tax=Porites evermanni TaxID=104178 RepID=A0ABN8MLX8_9CNID|nr:unnamed protein product [Porites evermanni]